MSDLRGSIAEMEGVEAAGDGFQHEAEPGERMILDEDEMSGLPGITEVNGQWRHADSVTRIMENADISSQQTADSDSNGGREVGFPMTGHRAVSWTRVKTASKLAEMDGRSERRSLPSKLVDIAVEDYFGTHLDSTKAIQHATDSSRVTVEFGSSVGVVGASRGKHNETVTSSAKTKKGKKKGKTGGIDALTDLMGKMNVKSGAEATRKKRRPRKHVGIMFASKAVKKHMLRLVLATNMEGHPAVSLVPTYLAKNPSFMPLQHLARIFPGISRETITDIIAEQAGRTPWEVLKQLKARSEATD